MTSPAGAAPRPKYRYVPSGLMLLFGIGFGFMSADGFDKVRRNPEISELTCAGGAVQETGARRWVKLSGCSIDFEGAHVISKGSRVESVWLPLVADDAPEGTRPATMLVSKDRRVIDLTAELEAANDDAAILGVVEKLLPLVTGEGSSGMTTTARPDDRVLVARSFPEVDGDYLVVEHGAHPDRRLAIIVAIASIGLLIGAGVHAFIARKKSRADAEALARWQQQQAAAYAQQQAYYQQQQYPPGSWGGPPQSGA